MSTERVDPDVQSTGAPAKQLAIEAIPRRSGITLCCVGEVDLRNAKSLEEALLHAIQGGFPMVEVDLERLHQGDGSARELLQKATQLLAREGRELRIWEEGGDV